jgi:hypothetical protein
VQIASEHGHGGDYVVALRTAGASD